MTMTEKEFAAQLRAHVADCILPYWLDNMQDPRGGFYGRRDGNDRLVPDAQKGAILNARILWTFAAAYRELNRPEYLEAAARAFDYILARFIDHEFGGVFWSVNADGTPADTKKQFYAIAFTIYGLAEYYAASGDAEALDAAMALFDAVEQHSRDRRKGGYIEACTRDWQPISDMRLSDKDRNSSKTMNTHLHILEGYTALLRVSGDKRVAEAVNHLIDIFLDHIIAPDGRHMLLFFDDEWRPADGDISYGHDIEASWLLLEAARELGDPEVLSRVTAAVRTLAEGALEGMRPDDSMIYEIHDDGREDAERHWWVQAEAMVGTAYLYRFHHIPEMLALSEKIWQYCLTHLADPSGEWIWSIRPDGTPNRLDDKAGFWKCPYHNTRACLETARTIAPA